jgi:hypothetical protein
MEAVLKKVTQTPGNKNRAHNAYTSERYQYFVINPSYLQDDLFFIIILKKMTKLKILIRDP